MPIKAPRLCPCGFAVPSGLRCKCEKRQDAERKARFDKTRPSSSGRGYNGTWDREKAAFLKLHPYCVFCGQPANTVDHKEAHKGDKVKFANKTNWQALCAPCHNGVKQRQERHQLKR